MKDIRLDYQGNLRYALIKINGQGCLFDIRPSNFIAHLFFPINWFLYHKVYTISPKDSILIEDKHSKASKFIIPTSLVGGITAFFTTWLRIHDIKIFQYFNTNFSMKLNIILLVVGVMIAYLLLQLLYVNRTKKIQQILGRRLGEPIFCKMKPQNPIRFFFNIFWAWLFIILLIVGFGTAFAYLGNLIIFLGFILLVFIYLGAVNGSYSARGEWRYQIIDIKNESGKY